MELKNAVAVCLISLFSATLVVLIARSLDSQAAARLEPQLAAIVAELQAIRNQGDLTGRVSTSAAQSHQVVIADGLIVYYFHGNMRCPTCQSIESQAHDVVKTDFRTPLDAGGLVWKVLNYEQSSAAALAKKFDVQAPVVVLAKMKGSEIQNWKRLDEVWALWNDKPAFTKYVRGEIERMLSLDKEPETAAVQAPGPTIPIPSTDSAAAKETPAIPIP